MSIKLHKFLPQHALSRLMGFLADRRWGCVTRKAIQAFIRRYQVDMQEAAEPDYRAYSTFNDFFTRPLRAGARPFASESNAVISPVDGFVSETGPLDEGRLLQAKGQYYSAASLLGGTERAVPFQKGSFFTAYLAPKNYHRIHMPIAGRLTEMIHIPGRLFSVNQASVQHVPQLFARNERVVCLFETAVGPMAVIMVGAMIVGSIATVWHGVVTPPTQKKISTWTYRDDKKFERGDEIGHFKLGSTVILLFPEQAMDWESFAPNAVLRLGEKIGTLK